ncbi:hypothetical protein A1QW_15730 [Vibrio anguillarum]|nr:hypothetical protein A1QW_15730 [Vibrio anguillarum]
MAVEPAGIRICVLPCRQLRNMISVMEQCKFGVLPHRQPRIGQEESNRPAGQAVNKRNHQVFGLVVFCFTACVVTASWLWLFKNCNALLPQNVFR